MPKAQGGLQMLNQPGPQLQLPQQPNYNWMLPQQQSVPMPAQPGTYAIDQNQKGTPAQPAPVMPIKKVGNDWINANMSKFGYRVNKGVEQFNDFMNTNPVAQGAMKTANTVSAMVDIAGPFAQMYDNERQSREMERAYRMNLLSQGPTNYSVNRGDYEINTGMVDPYNTGAKSKGQFTNMFYLPQAQDGMSMGPLSFSDEPVRRNVYQNTFQEVMDQRPVVETPRSSNVRVTPSSNVNPVSYSDTAEFLKSVEGFTPKAKWDYAQHSIGYGTKAKYKGEVISKQEAEQRLLEVVNPIIEQIQRRSRVPLNSGQIMALASLNYNTGSLANKLIDRLNKGEDPEIIANRIKTIALTGVGSSKVIPGLVNRRQKEASLFTRGYQEGGENTENMKIRIIQQPQQYMAYGGQSGYGLDLGNRRVYTDMPDSYEDSVSNAMGPVPREMATIEAEKGETILSDVDGDGMQEHMKIGGKRHSEGGTPLMAKPGDFIYSDTKKMKIKDPEVLAQFGKTMKAGGYTPAAIAKQYDINKYKAILQDPNADMISKQTAQMMIGNFEKKLGLLAFVQESKKGFPQGIPNAALSVMPEAAFGGYLDQYQSKGEVTPRVIKSKKEFEKMKQSGKYKQVPGTNNWEFYNKTVIPGTPDQTKVIPGTTGKKYIPNENAWWRSLTPQQKAAHNAKVRKMIKEDPVYTSTPDKTEVIKGTPEQVKEERDLITFKESTIPEITTTTTTGEKIPYGWTQQDMNNYMLALRNRGSIRKYDSVRQDVNPVMSDFRNMDWRGRAAELQGTYNSQLNTLGTFQSPTSLAANASFMAGQQAENLVNRAIDPVEQANVNIYNQVANQNAGMMNQAIAGAAQNRFLRSQDRAVLNQNYDNALRDADKALTQTMNQGLTNAAGIYNTNISESPYYFYNPQTMRMQFNDDNARAAHQAALRAAGPSDGDMASKFLEVNKQLAGLSAEEKKMALEVIFGNKMAGRTSSTTYPQNPTQNRTTVQQPLLPGGYSPFLYQTTPQ